MNWKIKESAILAAFVTAAIWVINLIMGAVFGTQITSLFSIQLPQFIPTAINPISMTAGQKLVGYISGYVPFTIPSIVVLFIATLAAVLLGKWLIDVLNIRFSAGGKVGRIAKEILIGTIPIYLLIVGLTITFNLTAIIFVVIYTLIAAYVAAKLADMLKVSI